MICLVYVPLCQNVFHGSELTILSDTLNSTKPSLRLASVHDFIIHEDGHVLWMILNYRDPRFFILKMPFRTGDR